MTLQAKKWTTDEVKDVIRKANTYWQANNPAEVRAEVRSFWDNAAYHTGNIEVYKLLKDQKMLDYSIRWAEHNDWKGATETDPAKWKYKNYGEGPEFVLFGDWQICFQTYIDLYNLAADEKKVARAKEVMGYEADSKANDYWWWADALYMVMPVMTKMYKLTGDTKYLRKLYDNILYSDSIMLDTETGLYFRDGRYVYPKHKTEADKKDFWARGDGWVLAGLAKVLQDLPETYIRQPFFVEKFTNLARGVAKLQQPEGYWTRSMMDPQQAPGPETHSLLLLRTALGRQQRLSPEEGVCACHRESLEIPHGDGPSGEWQGGLCTAHRRPGYPRTGHQCRLSAELRCRCLPVGCMRIL